MRVSSRQTRGRNEPSGKKGHDVKVNRLNIQRNSCNISTKMVGYIVKHGQIHYGYKSHIKLDVDHHLIRDLDVTPANLHDGDIDLVTEGDQAAYRDKGYSGTP